MRFLTLALLACAACALAPASAQDEEAPPRAHKPVERAAIVSPVKPKVTRLGENPSYTLFVGNSLFFYNNGIHTHLRPLVLQAEPRIVSRSGAVMVGMSGSGLDWHDVESYFK